MSKQEKILIIIPTKERLNDFVTFANSWVSTTEGKSDVLVLIDEDDTTYDNILSQYPFIYKKGKGGTVLELLNKHALENCKKYKYLSFIEDDCNFNTQGWETIFINKLNEIGDYGVVWGNDLINKDHLVGIPFLDSKIVEVLGYMSPPNIKFLWVDYFWKKVGEDLGTLHYFSDVIVEHRHYSTGKRQRDEISAKVDSHGLADKGQYDNYIASTYQTDLNKLKNARS